MTLTEKKIRLTTDQDTTLTVERNPLILFEPNSGLRHRKTPSEDTVFTLDILSEYVYKFQCRIYDESRDLNVRIQGRFSLGYWGKNLSGRLNLEKAQSAIPFNSAAFYQLLILIVMFSFIKVKAKILEL